MWKSALVLSFLVVLAFAWGRWSSAEDKPREPEAKTVRALRYRIVWADSALDLSHGGGRWVHELFFPALKVAATIVPESEYETGETFEVTTRPRLYVWRTDAPRTDLVGLSVPETDSPPEAEEVLVPAEFVRAIAAFADLTDTYRAQGTKLGARVTEALSLKPIANGGGRTAPTDDATPTEDRSR